MFWPTTEINDEGHDEETNDGEDLDTCEDKFGLTVDGYGEDIQANNEHDDQGNPNGD
jgi:hypothetical protein